MKISSKNLLRQTSNEIGGFVYPTEAKQRAARCSQNVFEGLVRQYIPIRDGDSFVDVPDELCVETVDDKVRLKPCKFDLHVRSEACEGLSKGTWLHYVTGTVTPV